MSGRSSTARENMILTPFDWAPLPADHGDGASTSCASTASMPGKAAAYSETMREALPTPGEALGPGGVLARRDRAAQQHRATSGATRTSRTAPGCAGALAADATLAGGGRAGSCRSLRSQEATILVPTSYSPCR